MQQVVHGEDTALFKAVCGSHSEADFGRAHLELVFEILRMLVGLIERNTRHVGVPPLREFEAGFDWRASSKSSRRCRGVYQVFNNLRTNSAEKDGKELFDASMRWP